MRSPHKLNINIQIERTSLCPYSVSQQAASYPPGGVPPVETGSRDITMVTGEISPEHRDLRTSSGRVFTHVPSGGQWTEPNSKVRDCHNQYSC